MEKTLHSSGEIKVSHTQAHKCGRFYADKSISLIPLSKYVKHTVMKYLGWLDIDMVKGHASIAIEIGKKAGKSFPVFENYVNNFDKIVCELSKFYSADTEKPLNKDNIKWLFNSMIYGGGFNNWIEGLKKGDETYEPRDACYDFYYFLIEEVITKTELKLKICKAIQASFDSKNLTRD